MYVALIGLVAIPLLAGVGIAWLGPRLSCTCLRSANLALTGLAALCALALLPFAGQVPDIAVEWLPGMGRMTLDLGVTSLYALVVTVWAALLSISAATASDGLVSWLTTALSLFGLAASVVSLLAGHFLLRYVALELVALCVSFVPVVELGNATGARFSRLVYLILRIGDAGLLIAILALMATTGMLEIGPALSAAATLETASLEWIAAGFALAVWVKVGGWPFHTWAQVGQQLSMHAQTWLYATIMPNLGLYLLYRTAPLLALSGPVQRLTWWVGAAGTVIAVLLALLHTDTRMGLSYVGAALGSLSLLAGSSGLKTVVWLCILAITPVRILLQLTPRLASRHHLRTGLLALGSLGLCTWCVCIGYWVRAAGAPLDVLLVAEAGIALLCVWATSVVGRSLSTLRNRAARAARALDWRGWATTAVVGVSAVISWLMFKPALEHLTEISHGHLPSDPTMASLGRYIMTTPGIWIVAIPAVVARLLRWRLSDLLAPLSERVYDLETALASLAQGLRSVIEVGIHEQLVALVVRLVVGSARVTQQVVERGLLEGSIRHISGAVVRGGMYVHGVVEQEGVEGLLRHTVRATLGLAHVARRWHTGRLRRNLLWVAISLALALIATVLYV
jgi:formate hydrogenlyase subunit 3/multisubunit Na+/H+ antiporter MnhD subunit